ncbi:MAG: hypothetical protein JSS61_04735 [Verrucomicrobia bacterium]|nr:hypothetical protein [Verrucomicrobiota bacterium]
MLKKLCITFALLLFVFSIFVGIDRLAHRRSNHFAADKILNLHPYSSEWDLPTPSPEEKEEIDRILSQKFTYLDKGSQSYVFISEDKKTILKFLKQHKLSSKSWLSMFPFSFNPYYIDSLAKEKKWKQTFDACKTSYLELKKETGLIYVHLNRTRDLHKKVTLFDQDGNVHHIDVDRTSFYLQKRAQLIYSRISELMHQGDVERAQQIITSVFSLIDDLGRKGVVENDPILRKNFGLIDDIAVQIDVGRLRIDPEMQKNPLYKDEIASISNSFRVWVEKNYPALTPHFEQTLEKFTERD